MEATRPLATKKRCPCHTHLPQAASAAEQASDACVRIHVSVLSVSGCVHMHVSVGLGLGVGV